MAAFPSDHGLTLFVLILQLDQWVLNRCLALLLMANKALSGWPEISASETCIVNDVNLALVVICSAAVRLEKFLTRLSL